jgi:beta-lactamase class C
VPTASTRGEIAPALRARAVQGYGAGGRPIGRPGDEQGVFDWPGTGQMYSSAQDMAQFLAANLGELADRRPLQEAMALAQRGVFKVTPQFTQALAWQVVTRGDLTLIEKNGGLDNTSTYIGFIPQERLGVVILMNRGGQGATRIGRQIILTLARSNADPGEAGADGD